MREMEERDPEPAETCPEAKIRCEEATLQTAQNLGDGVDDEKGPEDMAAEDATERRMPEDTLASDGLVEGGIDGTETANKAGDVAMVTTRDHQEVNRETETQEEDCSAEIKDPLAD